MSDAGTDTVMITSFPHIVRTLLPLIKNTGSTIIIRGLFGAARIVVLLFVAKHFGPDFGIDTVTIRRFASNRLLSVTLLRNVLTLKLITATIAYFAAMTFFLVTYGSSQGLALLSIIAVSIYSTLLLNAFVSYLQANLSVSHVISSNVISVIVFILLTVMCIRYDFALIAFAVVIPLSEMTNLLMTAHVFKSIAPIKLAFHKKILFSLLKESLPVGIAGLIVVIYLRLDNLMIGWYIGDKAVGEYAVAYRITEPFMLIFSSLSLSLYAHLSLQKTVLDRERAKRTLFTIMVPLSVLSIVIAGTLYMFSRDIIHLLSDTYMTSLGALMILSWAIVFKAINPQLTAFINSRGRFNLITLIAMGNLAITIVFNIVLIPKYGINGAAGAVLITEFINTLFQIACIIYIIRFPQRRLSP
jgi:PST family polysaccharide transporter